jgi:hypothetical protein
MCGWQTFPGLFRVTLSAGSGALPRLPDDAIHGDTRPQAVSVPIVTDRLACRGKQNDIVAGQKTGFWGTEPAVHILVIRS